MLYLTAQREILVFFGSTHIPSLTGRTAPITIEFFRTVFMEDKDNKYQQLM